MMSKKHKKVCTTLTCIEHFLILTSTNTGCISISAFVSSLFQSELQVKSLWLKVTAGIKKFKSII